MCSYSPLEKSGLLCPLFGYFFVRKISQPWGLHLFLFNKLHFSKRILFFDDEKTSEGVLIIETGFYEIFFLNLEILRVAHCLRYVQSKVLLFPGISPKILRLEFQKDTTNCGFALSWLLSMPKIRMFSQKRTIYLFPAMSSSKFPVILQEVFVNQNDYVSQFSRVLNFHPISNWIKSNWKIDAEISSNNCCYRTLAKAEKHLKFRLS